MDVGVLGVFEYEVMSVLVQQPHNAYGNSIRERLKQRTDKEPSAGAVYTTLDRLESKGFVVSWWGEATAERGGRRKRFFKIEAKGIKALHATEARISRCSNYGGLAPVGT